MKLFARTPQPIPRVADMSVADCYEAFMYASESYKKASGTDRAIIGVYIDDVLDSYLAMQ